MSEHLHKKREGKRELRFHGQFDIRPFDKTNDYMRDISSIHTRTLLVHREMGNDAGEIGGRKRPP